MVNRESFFSIHDPRFTIHERRMSLRISNVRLSVEEPEALLPERLARILGVAPAALTRWRILRKSLDARNKHALQFVYTAEVSLPEDEARLAARATRTPHPLPPTHASHE